MKKAHFFICKVILLVFLCTLVFLSFGCSFEQPGETVAEGQRRHQRNLRINQQGLMRDIDRVMLLDNPSRLTDRRVP